jgi:hypothetical protein
MNTTWRNLFLAISLPLLLGVACDPAAPGATGQLVVSPEAKLETARTLEIRLVPDDGKPFDVAKAHLGVETGHRAASRSLAEIDFPFEYEIGGGSGDSEHEHWRVVAWIAESEDVTRPNPGEWYGTREFTAEDCGPMFSGYCGVMFDIDLEIEFVRAGVASHRVASQPAPGEYIEETYGSYTMRCMEGTGDSARSIGSYIVRISANGRPITEVTGVRDGTLQDCWMRNIDADDDAEVLLFSKSVGSGGYANLYVYKFDGNQLQLIELPAPDPGLMGGFRGRDWYEVSDGALIRRFPVYEEDDPNCCPEGSDRVIEFDADAGAWKLATGSPE